MSRFGGPSTAAARSVQEVLHASVVRVLVRDGVVRPHLATVLVGGGGQVLHGVIWARALPAEGAGSLTGLSVMVTRAGGRWVIL